jgi:Spy/CpxP family protein refolding chaperone
MKIQFLIILPMVFLPLIVPPAWAQWPGPRGMRGGNRRPPCWRPDDLHMTPDQTERLKSIQRSYLSDIRRLRNDLANKRYQLRKLMADPASRSYDVRIKQEEVFRLEAQIQEKMVDYQLRVKEILTPQQFKRWRYQERFDHRMGPQHGMGTRNR